MGFNYNIENKRKKKWGKNPTRRNKVEYLKKVPRIFWNKTNYIQLFYSFVSGSKRIIYVVVFFFYRVLQFSLIVL